MIRLKYILALTLFFSASVNMCFAEYPGGAILTSKQIRITAQPARMKRAAGTWDARLKIKNKTKGPAAQRFYGPFTLVIANVSRPDVTLANSGGYTASGLPYLTLQTPQDGLGPGATLNKIILNYNNPSRKKFDVRYQLYGYLEPPPIVSEPPPASSDVTVFVNPNDSQVASVKGNGLKIDFYAEKNSDGSIASLKDAQVQSNENNKTAHVFYSQEDLMKVAVEDLTLRIYQLTDTTAQVEAMLANGNIYSASFELPASKLKKPSVSSRIPKSIGANTADAPGQTARSIVYVTKCGEPVDDAMVEMSLIPQSSATPRILKGFLTGESGVYSVAIPNVPADPSVLAKADQFLCDLGASIEETGTCDALSEEMVVAGIEHAIATISLQCGPYFPACFSAMHVAIGAAKASCAYNTFCGSVAHNVVDFVVGEYVRLQPIVKIPGTFPDVPGGWYDAVVTSEAQYAEPKGPFPEFHVNTTDASAIPSGIYSGPATWVPPWDAPSKVSVDINEYGLVHSIYFHGHNVSPYIALPLKFEMKNNESGVFEAYGLPPETVGTNLNYDCNQQVISVGTGSTLFQIHLKPLSNSPDVFGVGLDVHFEDFANHFDGIAVLE